MSSQHPDRDSLSAYLEEALSIDAKQWIEHHLGGCVECRAKLEEERVFLAQLGDLCNKIEPPPDFVEGVMARIAQYPAHQPAQELSWRRMGLWVASGAGALVVFLALGGWLLSLAGQIEAPEGASGVVAGVFSAAVEAWKYAEKFAFAAWSLLQTAWTVALVVVDRLRGAHIAVQLGLLLTTVLFNFWLTRLVLNYQRRQ